MKYWLNLYTWKTWNEFLKAGANVTGFRDRRWRTVQRIKKGDMFLCYMTGISRYFAIQEVTGEPFKDTAEIWGEAVFPSRVPVTVSLTLSPEYAVPIMSLKSQLSIFQDMKSAHSWTAFFRGSPVEIEAHDAKTVINALVEAENNPISHPFDLRKLERKVPIYETKSGTVSIPENDVVTETTTLSDHEVEEDSATHEEIQWLLLYLGERMGLDVWVASNDRSRTFQNKKFSELSRLRKTLPVQFDAATNRTIELIDVLWLQGNSIIAAFEIEHTSAVYSGLLRMADLITMQPNINIPLFIVAPDERFEKVQREINRPVFSKALHQSLPEICRFIPYSSLKVKVQQAEAGGFLRYLRPDFLDEIAESTALDEL